MKRIEKGTPGYLDYKKKVEIIRTVIYFLLVAAIFTLGYVCLLYTSDAADEL